MYDLDLNQLRDEVDSSITMPSFNELASRGARRRRHRIGAVLAAGAVVAALGVLVVDKSSVAEDPPQPTNPTKMSAEQIIDADDARLDWFSTGEDGFAVASWSVPCSTDSCGGHALAWTDDDWQTRSTQKLAAGGWVDVVDNRMIVFSPKKPEYILAPSGERTPVVFVDRPAPTDSWVDVWRADNADWYTVDIGAAVVRPIEVPAKYTLTQVMEPAPGELRAIAHDAASKGVLLVSHDGGATWASTPTPNVGGVATDGVNYVGYETRLGSKLVPPIRVTVSSDGGSTWTVLNGSELPFGTLTSLEVDSGEAMMISGSRLWRTTDDTLLHFAPVAGAPEMDYLDLQDNGGAGVRVIGFDGSQPYGWISTDDGETWTKYVPR